MSLQDRLEEIKDYARERIIAAGGLDVPGPERMGQVIAEIGERLDEVIEPANPLIEAASDAGIELAKVAIRRWLQKQYDELHAEGLVR